MIGPGEGIIGGISTLLEAFLPDLAQHVDLLYLPTARQRLLKDSGKVSLRNIASTGSQYARFWASLLRFRPYIIHIHSSHGIAWLKDTFFVLIGRLHGCHVVLHMHSGLFDEHYQKSPRLLQGYTDWVIRLCDAIIAVSAELAARLEHIIPDHVHILRNCIAVEKTMPHLLDDSANRATALFLGTVGPSKGAFDLLEAMGSLRSKGGCSLELLVAGHEEREGDLTKARMRLQELHLEEMCHLLGMVVGAPKMQLFSKADLFVLPSYNEGLPMAILEAMATGLPVISTPVGGIPEVIRDGYNGYLVQPGDVEILAEKLRILAGDPALREVMGHRSREIAERELDVKPYTERLVTLYKSITDA
jgi:glycosyltransferase involved in cell wall biosynthesis